MILFCPENTADIGRDPTAALYMSANKALFVQKNLIIHEIFDCSKMIEIILFLFALRHSCLLYPVYWEHLGEEQRNRPYKLFLSH